MDQVKIGEPFSTGEDELDVKIGETFSTVEDELDVIIGETLSKIEDELNQVTSGETFGTAEDELDQVTSGDAFGSTEDELNFIMGDDGGPSPDGIGGLLDAKAASDEVLERLQRSDNVRIAQKDRWDRGAHGFQTCRKTVGGVEHRGAAAISRAEFASGTSPLQAFWSDPAASELDAIRRKKRDTWASKPQSERAWSDERRQNLRDTWAAKTDSEKEEKRKKHRASTTSAFARRALAMQRSVDERLGAAGVLRPGAGRPSLARSATFHERIVTAPNPKAVGARRCELCMKFARAHARSCPGRDGEQHCVYFEVNGAMKRTRCARCARYDGEHIQRCKGGRRGEGRCQYYTKDGQPKKTLARCNTCPL